MGSAYNAMIMAPYVASVVPFVIGFFLVLGVMANAQGERRRPVISKDHPVNPKVMSNEEIIKQFKENR